MAMTGFAEAPSIAPDDKSLYYHVKDTRGVFVFNRAIAPVLDRLEACPTVRKDRLEARSIQL